MPLFNNNTSAPNQICTSSVCVCDFIISASTTTVISCRCESDCEFLMVLSRRIKSSAVETEGSDPGRDPQHLSGSESERSSDSHHRRLDLEETAAILPELRPVLLHTDGGR